MDFLEEMITTHQENLSAIAAGLAQLHARAADQPVAPTATVPTPSVPKPPAPPLTPSQPVHGPKPDGEANPSPSGEGVPEERERGG